MRNAALFLIPTVLALLGTGCASGPAMVSLGSYFEGTLEEAVPEAVAQAEAPPPAETEQKVEERVVVEEEAPEYVTRERVIGEEVIIEEPSTVRVVRPRRVYVSGYWYDWDDVIVTHVHGPWCGHYFYRGVWYNDPDLIILDAFTPGAAYIYYDGLWYPRGDIFISTYYRRYPSYGSWVAWGAGVWPWTYFPHWFEVDVYHHYYDGKPDAPAEGGVPEEGGRAPKTESGLPAGRSPKAPLTDRRARPLLVNDNIGVQGSSGVDSRLSRSAARGTGYGRQPGRTIAPAMPSQRSGSPGYRSGGTRSLKARRTTDALKSRRDAAEAAASRVSPRIVVPDSRRSALSRGGASRSTVSPSVSRSAAQHESRKSARGTSYLGRPVRRPGLIDVGRSSGSTRSKPSAVNRSETYSSRSTVRETRPSIRTQKSPRTTTSIQSGRSTKPSRSVTIQRSQPRVRSRTIYRSAPRRSSFSGGLAPARRSSSARSTYSRSVKPSIPSSALRAAPSRSSGRSSFSTKSLRSSSRSSYRSSRSIGSSRSRAPSVRSSRSHSSLSRSVSRSSRGSVGRPSSGSGGRAARSARR